MQNCTTCSSTQPQAEAGLDGMAGEFGRFRRAAPGRPGPSRLTPAWPRPRPTAPPPRPRPPVPPRRPDPPWPRNRYISPFPVADSGDVTASPAAGADSEGAEFVRWVKSTLNRALGLRLSLNGALDAETRNAVRRFQSDRRLLADGIVGPETRRALSDARRKLAEEQSLRSEIAQEAFETGAPRSTGAYPVDLAVRIPWLTHTLLRLRQEQPALRSAMGGGLRDENALTSMLFYARHPERGGRRIVKGEPHYPALSAEWLRIRDTLVRPALRSPGSAGVPALPSAPALGGAPAIVRVRGIQVAQQIAPQIESLLSAAAADGIALSGGGYRSHQRQIELRRVHCGPTDYDIYRKPSNQCTPPTATPGKSMHERGLAIDFTHQGKHIRSREDFGFQWLARNAARFGLYNLPSEPWHWSVNGR